MTNAHATLRLDNYAFATKSFFVARCTGSSGYQLLSKSLKAEICFFLSVLLLAYKTVPNQSINQSKHISIVPCVMSESEAQDDRN